MSEQQISRKDQQCISNCIFLHWSEHSQTPPDDRAKAYERCLNSCKVCS